MDTYNATRQQGNGRLTAEDGSYLKSQLFHVIVSHILLVTLKKKKRQTQ